MRRILASLAASAAIALAIAAPASGAITGSHVTTPSGTFFGGLVDRNNPKPLHVAGTTTGGSPGDKVQIACVRRNGFIEALFGNAKPVDGSGRFSADVLVKGVFGATACKIQALPEGATTGEPPDASPAHFTGPRANFGQLLFNHVGNDPSKAISSVLVSTQKPLGAWEHFQTGGCTLNDAWLTDPVTLRQSDFPFYCNAWLRDSNEGDANPATRSELVVDGANAYLPDTASFANGNAPHLPPPLVTYTYRTTNGDLTVHSFEQAVRCTPDTSLPTTPAKCADFVPVGVSVETFITDRGPGTTSQLAQRFFSTDGHRHKLDLLFNQETHTPNKTGGVRFGWVDSAYKSRGPTDALAGPASSGPGAFFVKTDVNGADGTFPGVQGSVAFARAPRRVQFLRGTSSPLEFTEFELAYKRTVKPKAPAWFGWTFGLGTRAGALANAARKAQKAFRPRVKIKKPPKGTSTRRRKVTVRGTSHDASGRVTVSVNGHRAKVKKDGSWRIRLNLKLGRNKLTAKATNRYGNSTRARRTVTRRPK